MDDVTHATGRERLATELRRLRELSGVSGRELARRMAISQSKVSRIEAGLVLPSLPEVMAWGAALDLPDDTRERLAFLTESAFTEVQPWRDALRGRGHLQDKVRERESAAARIRTFQPSVVPGLLQTAQYARQVLSVFQPPYSEDDFVAALAARLNRQQAVFDERRKFDFLITEAALRWRSGPAHELIAQWDRIMSIMTLNNVSIGFMLLDREAVTTMSHGFVVYDSLTDDRHAFVTVEMVHATVTINDPHDVGIYEDRWSLLSRTAIFDDEARGYLAALIKELVTSIN